MKNFIMFFTFLISTFSCKNYDYEKYGKVTFHATSDKEYFIFTVDDTFYGKYKNSPNNKDHPRLSDQEYKMLKTILSDKGYCVRSSFFPKFEILSRQNKIYDATFAKLIADNYNAKPLAPVSYYGRCL